MDCFFLTHSVFSWRLLLKGKRCYIPLGHRRGAHLPFIGVEPIDG